MKRLNVTVLNTQFHLYFIIYVFILNALKNRTEMEGKMSSIIRKKHSSVFINDISTSYSILVNDISIKRR